MAHPSGNHVASLADQLEARIDVKHASLRAALSRPCADPADVGRLIADIGRLAQEFSCAIDVEQRLRQLQHAARRAATPTA